MNNNETLNCPLCESCGEKANWDSDGVAVCKCGHITLTPITLKDYSSKGFDAVEKHREKHKKIQFQFKFISAVLILFFMLNILLLGGLFKIYSDINYIFADYTDSMNTIITSINNTNKEINDLYLENLDLKDELIQLNNKINEVSSLEEQMNQLQNIYNALYPTAQ